MRLAQRELLAHFTRTSTSRLFLTYGAAEAASRLATFAGLLVIGGRYGLHAFAGSSLALSVAASGFLVTVWGTDRTGIAALARSPDGHERGILVAVARRRLCIALLVTPACVGVASAAHVSHLTLPIVTLVLAAVPDAEYFARFHGRALYASLPRLASSLTLLLTSVLLPASVAVLSYAVVYAIANIAVHTTLYRRAPIGDSGRLALPPGDLWIGVNSVASAVATYSDQVILTAMVGVAAASPYIAAYRFLSPAVGVAAVSQAVWLPRLPDNPKAVEDYLRFNAWLLGILAALIVCGALIAAYVLGDQTRLAAVLLAVLAPQLVLIGITDSRSRGLMVNFGQRKAGLAEMVAAAVALVAFVVLIPLLKVWGGVVGTYVGLIVYVALLKRMRSTASV